MNKEFYRFFLKSFFTFLLIFSCFGSVKIWGKDNYVREVVCQFNSNDIQANFDDPYFRFDVDENENIYFLGEIPTIKVFNPKGQKKNEFAWVRRFNKFYDFFSRGGNLFIYAGHEVYACDSDGKNGQQLRFKKYLSEITLVNGQVFDFINGKVVFSFGQKSNNVLLPFFKKNMLLKTLLPFQL